jgi:F-type H+-transporting ATPase subunit a
MSLVTETTKKRTPVKRWIILAMIILGALAAYGPWILGHVIAPSVVLPAEAIWPGVQIFPGVPFTNTMLATLIADVLLLLLAFSAWRYLKAGNLIPGGGFYNAFETIFEFLWSSVEGMTGKWARKAIWMLATIFLLIFVANMVKLVPGFESIGYLEEGHQGRAWGVVPLFGSVYALNPEQRVVVDTTKKVVAEEVTNAVSEETHGMCKACILVPFLRGSATDLNFTFALAVIAVVMVQVYGIWALKGRYFLKFVPVTELSKGIFGMIAFVVGLLELILEFVKVISFSFRLFGNVFAGVLLLSVVGALVPIILPPGLYLFEVFFGIIQAYVFFLLASMFISMAVVSHSGEEHSEAH